MIYPAVWTASGLVYCGQLLQLELVQIPRLFSKAILALEPTPMPLIGAKCEPWGTGSLSKSQDFSARPCWLWSQRPMPLIGAKCEQAACGNNWPQAHSDTVQVSSVLTVLVLALESELEWVGGACYLYYRWSSSLKQLLSNCYRIKAEQQSDTRSKSSTYLILRTSIDNQLSNKPEQCRCSFFCFACVSYISAW